MSKPNFFQSNVVYHDNSTEYNIDARGNDLASVLRACEAEDIEPVQEQERNCPFVVAEKLRELNLYTYEEFVHMYRKAAETDAKTLAEFLTKYRQLGVLDFKNCEKKEILERLQAYFPTMKKYSYNNFVYYF